MKRFALAMVALSGCAVAPVGELERAIIGGTADPGDPAVMMLVSYPQDQSVIDECSAVLIAPGVLLTAAHCVDAATHPDYQFGVFPSQDGSNVQINQLLPVSEVHAHPQYVANSSTNDVGVVVLTVPVAVSFVPVNRLPLDASFDNEAARIVGYGRTDYNIVDSAGTRRQAETQIVSWDAATVTVGDALRHTCVGDSGAPAFVMQNGAEVLLGTDSNAPVGCPGASVFMRTDHYLDFLAPWLPAAPPDMATASDLSSPATSDLAQSADLTVAAGIKSGGCSVSDRPSGAKPWWAFLLAPTLVRLKRGSKGQPKSSRVWSLL